MYEKIYNPKEAICLLLFAEKKNVEDVKDKLYGKRNSKVPRWIRELRDKGNIVSKLSTDGRYHFFQTNPKTLLNYIDKKLKEKAIETKNNFFKLTSDEKKELLKYLKKSSFKEFVKKFVNHINVKNELFTFYGLMDHISINIIYIVYVAKYIEEKEGIDPADKKSLNLVSEENKSNLDLIQLGYPLLGKMGYLSPRADMIAHHYGKLIKFVEVINKDTKELKQDINKNGNSHGLS